MNRDFFAAWRHCGELQDTLEKNIGIAPKVFQDIETDMLAMRDGYEAIQNQLANSNQRIAELEAAIKTAREQIGDYLYSANSNVSLGDIEKHLEQAVNNGETTD